MYIFVLESLVPWTDVLIIQFIEVFLFALPMEVPKQLAIAKGCRGGKKPCPLFSVWPKEYKISPSLVKSKSSYTISSHLIHLEWVKSFFVDCQGHGGGWGCRGVEFI